MAENTYKSSVEKYNKAQEEYNEDMTNSCKVSVWFTVQEFPLVMQVFHHLNIYIFTYFYLSLSLIGMGITFQFFGEMEQTHLNQIVEFAKRFGDIETDLVEELKKNCESILGG